MNLLYSRYSILFWIKGLFPLIPQVLMPLDKIYATSEIPGIVVALLTLTLSFSIRLLNQIKNLK